MKAVIFLATYKALNPGADIPASLINNYNQDKNRQYITLTDSKQIIKEPKKILKKLRNMFYLLTLLQD